MLCTAAYRYSEHSLFMLIVKLCNNNYLYTVTIIFLFVLDLYHIAQVTYGVESPQKQMKVRLLLQIQVVLLFSAMVFRWVV